MVDKKIVFLSFSSGLIISFFLILAFFVPRTWAVSSNGHALFEEEFYLIMEDEGSPGLHLNTSPYNDGASFLDPSHSLYHQGSLKRPLFRRIIPWPDVNGQTYDVPIVLNDSVKAYLNYFQEEIPDRFGIWLGRSTRYLPMMKEAFRKYGLPEDLIYVSLIESGFNPRAHSRAHAVGPWQFMKATGRTYGLRVNRWVDERRDPEKSSDAAARHLKDLYEHFGTWPLAMASYNAGQRRIQQALKRGRVDNYWDLRSTRHIRRETKGYVPKFMAATIIAKKPEAFGFYPEYEDLFVFDKVTVPGSASLRVIAKTAKISLKALKRLNPELRTDITPPYKKEYVMRLPKGSKNAFETRYAGISDEKKVFRSQYVVRRNDTLSRIAMRYGTTVSQLAGMNNRSPRKILRVGEVIYIPKSQARTPRKKRQKSYTDEQIVYRVQPGDTLWDISNSFKVSLRNLKRYNGIGRNTRIYPGDVLILGKK